MPTLNGDRVPFGLDQAVPTTAPTAWGARLIVTQDGYVDFVPDRQGLAGVDRDAFIQLLEQLLPVDKLRTRISALLRTGTMDTRQAQQIIVYADDQLTVVANTNASAGYCYIAAWPTMGEPK